LNLSAKVILFLKFQELLLLPGANARNYQDSQRVIAGCGVVLTASYRAILKQVFLPVCGKPRFQWVESLGSTEWKASVPITGTRELHIVI
jgi:hypothetical protein